MDRRQTASASPVAALLSTIRPYAVLLGYPVTRSGLADRLDQDGAQRAEIPEATADDPAFVVASLSEPLRQAVKAVSPGMLAFLRVQASSSTGRERAARFLAVVSGHPALVLLTAEAVRMTPEALMTMLLDGDTITVRVAEEVAAHFGADLDWLLGRVAVGRKH